MSAKSILVVCFVDLEHWNVSWNPNKFCRLSMNTNGLAGEEGYGEGEKYTPSCPHTRVQGFWHLFRNSKCFMCFWFLPWNPKSSLKKTFP
jgi:hypothetical protein